MLTWIAVAVQSRSSSGIYVPELWGPAIFAFLVLPSLYRFLWCSTWCSTKHQVSLKDEASAQAPVVCWKRAKFLGPDFSVCAD